MLKYTVRLVWLLGLAVNPAFAAASPCVGLDTPQDARAQATALLAGKAFAGVVAGGELHTLSAGTGGEIAELHVAHGARVERGAVLLSMVSAELNDALRTAALTRTEREAGKRSAAANLRQVDSRLARRERNPALFPAEETEALKHERSVASAVLDAADAALQRAVLDLAHVQTQREALRVRSPQPGIVVALLAGRGERVASGTALLRVATGTAPRIRFAVPTDAPAIEVGTLFCVLADAATPIAARVSHIDVGIDPVLGARIASAVVASGENVDLTALTQQAVLVVPLDQDAE